MKLCIEKRLFVEGSGHWVEQATVFAESKVQKKVLEKNIGREVYVGNHTRLNNSHLILKVPLLVHLKEGEGISDI